MIQAAKDLRTEYAVEPVGIDSAQPRFSWCLEHAERGQKQTAYQVVVSDGKKDAWDTGKVVSSENFGIVYGGKPLESNKTYCWKVKWWDKDGAESLFTGSCFDTGLLQASDWKAKWIWGKNLLRGTFKIEKEVKRARVFVCGLGFHELYINGKKAGDRKLEPGWTDYKKIVLYSTFEIEDLLRKGENAVGIMLGNGRHVPDYKYSKPKAIMQIEIEFTEGVRQTVITDEAWKTCQGPIVSDGIYLGETYDAREEKNGWDMPGYDDGSWERAETAEPSGGKLVSSAGLSPVRIVKTMQPKKMTEPKPGVFIFDFGQNFSGWLRLRRLKGAKGTAVTIRHSELVRDDGNLNAIPMGGAKAADVYIMKGEGIETYEPRFTYHGFRFAEITGFPGMPSLDDIEAKVVHSDVEQTGSFSCSDDLINAIHKIILWGQVSNLMSVPTDCPQRAERMGWMGDAQLSAEEAVHNFDMSVFYPKYIRDMRHAQKESGDVPDVVPPYWDPDPSDPAWGTAYITISWHLYLYYGDRRILEENYEGFKKWISYLGSVSKDLIVMKNTYGDWCPPMQVKSYYTPGELTSTWYFYENCLLISRIAKLLGNPRDEKDYAALAQKVKEAFNKTFLKETFYCDPYSQTANLLPLFLDMAPPEKQQKVVETLVNTVVVNNSYHLNTGIIGTRFLFETLTKFNRPDIALRIIKQESFPGWGYMIREGATTVWERWEYLDDGGMNSHNHIMLGSVDAWFYRKLAGIQVDPDNPGFEKMTISPYFAPDLKFAGASMRTVRGFVSSGRERKNGNTVLKISIPVGSTASVVLPAKESSAVTESGKAVWKDGKFVSGSAGVKNAEVEQDNIVIEVSSGNYLFEINK